jgi:hypothetical protein
MQGVSTVLVDPDEALINPPGFLQFTRLMILKRAEQVGPETGQSALLSRHSGTNRSDPLAAPALVRSQTLTVPSASPSARNDPSNENAEQDVGRFPKRIVHIPQHNAQVGTSSGHGRAVGRECDEHNRALPIMK